MNLPIQSGKIWNTINAQWVVMGAYTGVEGAVSTCDSCPLL